MILMSEYFLDVVYKDISYSEKEISYKEFEIAHLLTAILRVAFLWLLHL